MRIRTKLLILMLLIAVIPLGINTAINQLSQYRLGRHLATQTRALLTEDAHAYLQAVVENYQRLQERNRKVIDMALLQQSRDWLSLQKREAGNSPAPPKAYQLLQDYQPGLVLRQYTIFESGESFCYPTDDDFARQTNLQQLPWYRSARENRELTRTLATDPVTGQPALIVVMPLLRPNGTLAGMTAVSRSLFGLFEDLVLPEKWGREVSEMLVALEKKDGALRGLRIVATRENLPAGKTWQELGQGDIVAADDPVQTETLMEKVVAGQGGTFHLMSRGQETHWIVGGSHNGEPFPLIIVPHDSIIGRATDTEQHVLSKIFEGLKTSALLLAAVTLAVALLAVFFARRVTRPLSQLAGIANSLAAGNFRARVEICTGDELEDLGRIFNALGPQLKEHQRMAHALALAGEIQQHLLPQGLPNLKGFDIFGQGTFCDETGGDYFDFIPLGDNGSAGLGLAVGDVSGHGIGPALLMASVRGVLRSHADRYGSDLGGLFAQLNSHLSEAAEDDRFMTLFYGVLSPSNHSLIWNSAGHGPVLWYRQVHNAIEELPSTGVPLGMLEGAGYPPAGPLVLESADILLIGTDGIWETRSPAGDLFGTEHLKELLVACAGQSAREIYATIVNKISEFRQGGELEDDLTLVVVKVPG